MTQYPSPTLLTPPPAEEEVYPYRRVWFSILAEAFGVFSVTVGIFVAYNFIGLQFPSGVEPLANIVIALLPAALWGIFALFRERFAEQPRVRLASSFVLTLLVANAVGIPLLQFLDVTSWLSLSGTFDRILGYAFTVGVVHEGIKYLIFRFWLWPEQLRIRYDTLAYASAIAIAYATVDNLTTSGLQNISPDEFAARALHTYVIHLTSTFLISYGLSELHFGGKSLILLPVTVLSAILLTGSAVSLRASIVNANFFLGTAAPNMLFGIVFSLLVLLTVTASIAFIYNAAERKEREAYVGNEL